MILTEKKNYTRQQFFKSAEQMQELFSDLPDSCANTEQIALRSGVVLSLDEPSLPEYPIPPNQTLEQFFRQTSEKGLKKRLSELRFKNRQKPENGVFEYKKRLDREISIILEMGFPGYFLIVMDFIRWARKSNIPVGPGRGSGAGSCVAWALEITDLDPLDHDLLFERFLNPERVSLPDFDIDFCVLGRDQVIDYVVKRYGKSSVSQIVTFGTLAARAVVRDVTRVQGKPYGLGDKIAKLIPSEVGINLKTAFAKEQFLKDFVESEEEARDIWAMAESLEGLVRNIGKHAGGVVIAPSQLSDVMPVMIDDETGGLITQFDKDDVESAGLVKFDFLGLRTLTIIDKACRFIEKDQGKVIEIRQLDTGDCKVFEMLSSGETSAIFQLESRGMKDLIRRLQPESFDDLVALVALFRPGPLQSGMVDDFIDRKHGRSEITYFHPLLESILKPTYGVILYQEQVMQIAQVMGGYSLGSADLLRRAMGKKKPEEMSRQRDIFLKGSIKNKVSEELARRIFDLMEKFAGYGFNRSHSAAYALLAYQTAFLKTYYPAAFMAAVLTIDMENSDKLVPMIREAKRLKLNLLPPDINKSDIGFKIENGSLRYGLAAIRGIGEAAVQNITVCRENGDFKDLFDLCSRIGPTRLSQSMLEALVHSGACDNFGVSRLDLKENISFVLNQTVQKTKNETIGIDDIFGFDEQKSGINGEFEKNKQHRRGSVEENLSLLSGEYQALGFYLSDHPYNFYRKDLDNLGVFKICKLKPSNKLVKVAGLVTSLRFSRNRRGEAHCSCTLDDGIGLLDVYLNPKIFFSNRHLIFENSSLVVSGQIVFDDLTRKKRMKAVSVIPLEDFKEAGTEFLWLSISSENKISPKALIAQFEGHTGGSCPVRFDYMANKISGTIWLGANWFVKPDANLLNKLKRLLGDSRVGVKYKKSISTELLV